MRPELVICSSAEEFAVRSADLIGGEIERSIADRGVCRLALSGGETPRPVYRRLAAGLLGRRFRPSEIEVFFTDERCVPPDDPRSNYRAARDTLLSGCGVYPSHVHRIQAERADRDKAALEYEQEMPDALDLVLLGMGRDGHTASLFPGSAALEETVRKIVAVEGGDPDLWRLTITPPVIERARSVIVMISGGEKADAVRRALEGPYDPKALPVQLALGRRWILDRAAAGAIRKNP